MTMRSQVASLHNAMLRSCCRREFTKETHRPIVSFCFDDFPRTAYTEGGQLLSSYGVHGTYYAAFGLMSQSTALGEMMRPDDLDAVLKDGHEVANHTFSHCSVRKAGLGEFITDTLRGRDAIRRITGVDELNFSYPFGHVSLRSKLHLSKEFRSCRGIQSGVNSPSADLNLLSANSLYGDLNRLGYMVNLLLENELKSGWLIFYTHDVRPNPSPYGCTPELFDKVLAFAMEHSQVVLPVGECLALTRGV